jgi:hypothetical protein
VSKAREERVYFKKSLSSENCRLCGHCVRLTETLAFTNFATVTSAVRLRLGDGDVNGYLRAPQI